MKPFYLLCAIAGAVIPYSQFVPWVAEHGLNLNLLLTELFSTRIGAFFGLDVLVSAVVLLAFIVGEGKRLRMKMLWIPAAATCLIGVSCGLPLFLFMREPEIKD
jgi:membrane associated rhomboid family serine protease